MLCRLATTLAAGLILEIRLSNDLAALISSSIMMIFIDDREFYGEQCITGQDLDLFIQKMAITQIDILQPHTRRRFRRLFQLDLVFNDNKILFRIETDPQRTIQGYNIVFDTILDQELQGKRGD